MVWIAGGQFAMGSDGYYQEEAPVHQARVDGFFIDPHPTTNQQFSLFVHETGWVTVAEKSPDPEMYPGAPPENLVPGSLVFFMTEEPVDLSNYANWWAWTPGADWRHRPAARQAQTIDTGMSHLGFRPVVREEGP